MESRDFLHELDIEVIYELEESFDVPGAGPPLQVPVAQKLKVGGTLPPAIREIIEEALDKHFDFVVEALEEAEGI